MTRVWGHDGCGTYWGQKLTTCPRHPGEKLEETTMPKVTRFGGASDASIESTATGVTATDSGFTEDTDRIRNEAAERQAPSTENGEQTTFLGDDGEPSGLVAGGDDTPAKDEPPFDPSELSVADVQALLAECTDEEKAAVITAEKADKNRKGITGA